MVTLGNFKQGDTFEFYAHLTNEFDVPYHVELNNIKSQIRSKYEKQLICDLDIIYHPSETGTYLLSSKTPLPIGELYCDIQIDYYGVIMSTETFIINVEKDITK